MMVERSHDGLSRILVVDDNEATATVLARLLQEHGEYEVRVVNDPRQVLPTFREAEPDLLILDLVMPGLSGFDVIRQVTARVPEGEILPILIVSGNLDPDAKLRALALGATDMIAKPFDELELSLRVRNALRTRGLAKRLADRAAAGTRMVRVAEVEVAERLALVAELRDYQSGAHVVRVGRSAGFIGRRLGLPEDEAQILERAAQLHDIGKIGIPDTLLLKQDSLTLEEFDIMKQHTTLGARMLAGSSSRILQMAEEVALYHHENWDGTGYTPGLAGESIPLPGRIVAVADVFDALTNERPYKAAWNVSEAIEWIRSVRGQKFDPRVVDAFLDVAALEDLTHLDELPEELSDLPHYYSMNRMRETNPT